MNSLSTLKQRSRFTCCWLMMNLNSRRSCSGTCPAYGEMEYHPHEFVYMVEKGDIEPLQNSESLYKCLSCFACVERCPRGVEPAKLVEAVRLSVIRKQGQNRLKPQMIPAMIDEDMPQQAIVSAFRKYSK